MSAAVAAPGSAFALQSGVTFEDPPAAAIALVVFALLSALSAGGVAAAYRWYFKDAVPEGITLLVGVAIVSLYITTASLGSIISTGSANLFRPGVVFFNVAALGAAAFAAPVGRRLGDKAATELFALSGVREIEGELGAVVRSVGRVIPVKLPDEIDDMESYDPVSEETKEELAGKTLLFPRRLTVEELRERLVARLKEDYGVGYVDLDLTEDGDVEYVALGSRAAGIGATIAPGTVAVAIRGDPPHDATVGDAVQVWRAGETPERVTSGELRGVADDVVTLAVDEGDAEQLDPSGDYRLVTLPAEPRADREFANLLRSVDETMGTVVVEPGGRLVGETPRSTGTIVVAIKPADGRTVPIPARDRPFEAGDAIYPLGRPDALRRLEERAAAAAGDEAPDGTGGEADERPSTEPPGAQSS